ncbi:unnamed protein product [Lactuca saligna]|uniref:Uncharacterized protein n=1 Tax=Lactuca saligna TaxID=75948 RepID=A0AA35ZZQ8_LACSI|nr:unnamed protein product [Lactuca saligna]
MTVRPPSFFPPIYPFNVILIEKRHNHIYIIVSHPLHQIAPSEIDSPPKTIGYRRHFRLGFLLKHKLTKYRQLPTSTSTSTSSHALTKLFPPDTLFVFNPPYRMVRMTKKKEKEEARLCHAAKSVNEHGTVHMIVPRSLRSCYPTIRWSIENFK